MNSMKEELKIDKIVEKEIGTTAVEKEEIIEIIVMKEIISKQRQVKHLSN